MSTTLQGYPISIVERHRARKPPILDGECEVLSVERRGTRRPVSAPGADIAVATGLVVGFTAGLTLWAVLAAAVIAARSIVSW